MASVECGIHAIATDQIVGQMQVFDLPVDSECKAKKIKFHSVAKPHMRAFHLAWICFFMTFTATFAPAALLPIIREDLGLTATEAGLAGVLATLGAITGLLFMGTILDVLGPRVGNGIIMLLLSPQIFLMSLVTTPGGFQCVRYFIGISLCGFVACSYWVGSMFNVRIVGTANAIAAGWGNMGGGVTAILMPAIEEGIKKSGVSAFAAWRWSFFIPGSIFLIMGMLIFLFSVDAPRGDYRDLKKSGAMAKGKGNALAVIKVAVSNYRTWVLGMIYGYCFGIELTMDNVIVTYFYDQFGLDLVTAGGLGALFGLMNIFSRASGGIMSDLVAARWGMRGRLWLLWILVTLGGAFCMILSTVDYSLAATLPICIIFAIFAEQGCGATYGVVPFVSRRSYGVVSGIVGAGGNAGSCVTQILFFAGTTVSPVMTMQNGFFWMGVMTLCVSSLVWCVHFPQWGSMLFPGNPDFTEENYYLKEWTAEEIALGLHCDSMKFAMESRSQRGFKGEASYKAGSASNSLRGSRGEASSKAGSIFGSLRGAKGVVEPTKVVAPPTPAAPAETGGSSLGGSSTPSGPDAAPPVPTTTTTS